MAPSSSRVEPSADPPPSDLASSLAALPVPAGDFDRWQWVALLRADQLRRWQRGHRITVEEYLSNLTPLRADPELVLDLIYNEIVAREQTGERPTLEEYLRRFPEHQESLRRQFALHSALSDSVLAVPGEAGQLSSPLTSSHGIHSWQTIQYQSPAEGKDSEAAAAGELPAVPGYEVLAELGRGGMGVVYGARQIQLKRLVALKMIRAGVPAGAQELARFRKEAEAVARLHHPNIVQIYEIGEWHPPGGSPVPYFSLEFVEGGSLQTRLGGRPQPARVAAQMVETLARAMHTAHHLGIIHRDLKPANVLLVGGFDTPLGQCIPKISDFGLAKRLDDESGQTRSGTILGTPSYMAPEQATGQVRQIGPLVDVYALGAILYQMLTGQPPFHGGSLWTTLEQVRRQEPVPPCQREPKVPRDLETICLKCLEKEPHRRYPSALALADDLRAYLSGEPIEARPQGTWERAVRWGRQRPLPALLLGLGGVALVGLLVGSWWHSALTVSAVAVASLLAGGGWYYARLQTALRQLAEEQLAAQRQVERLHLLLELTHRVMGVTDLDTLLRLLTETTTRLANAERATVFLIDPQRQELWSKVALGENVEEIRVPLGAGIAGTVAQTGEIIMIPDAYADPRFNREVDRQTGYRTRNLLAIPLRAQNGRVLGVFQVLNKQSGDFLPEDLEPLTALSAAAAVAIENAQRHHGGR